ncbi:MAG: hemerythrin domain-containing protein [Pseudomonadota bacterium]
MTNNGLPEQLPGFDDPLGLLRACHNKMLVHCGLLESLPDTPDPAVAQQVLRYFSTNAVTHHRDEEQDLFPRLNRQSIKLAELIHRLRQEHTELDRLWATIAAVLRRPAAAGTDPDFRSTVALFCALARDHIARENGELLPLAASSLSRAALGEIGESMAARRGVPYSAL